MKKGNVITIFMAIILIGLFVLFANNCSGNCCDSSDETQIKQSPLNNQPLNISVFLDLSDRLKKEKSGMSQYEKDIIIINNLVDIFKKQVLDNKIINSKDCFKIFFYPQPNVSKINDLASRLGYNFEKIDIKLKKNELKTMKESINENLEIIYSETIGNDNWPGCDIWGFFKERVKHLCVKENYRNILVILTDGYIFHKDNKITEGNKTSYILPGVLTKANPQLICGTSGLNNLEVLFLEINPLTPQQGDKIKNILGNWLEEMGVSRYEIHTTDLPSITKPIIESFIE